MHEALLKYTTEPQAPTLEPLVVSYNTAAVLLDKSKSAITSAVFKGKMPKPIKIGSKNYFRKKDFDAWLLELGIIEDTAAA